MKEAKKSVVTIDGRRVTFEWGDPPKSLGAAIALAEVLGQNLSVVTGDPTTVHVHDAGRLFIVEHDEFRVPAVIEFLRHRLPVEAAKSGHVCRVVVKS